MNYPSCNDFRATFRIINASKAINSRILITIIFSIGKAFAFIWKASSFLYFAPSTSVESFTLLEVLTFAAVLITSVLAATMLFSIASTGEAPRTVFSDTPGSITGVSSVSTALLLGTITFSTVASSAFAGASGDTTGSLSGITGVISWITGVLLGATGTVSLFIGRPASSAGVSAKSNGGLYTTLVQLTLP